MYGPGMTRPLLPTLAGSLALLGAACSESGEGLNATPIAFAGEDLSVLPGAIVELSGVESRDPDGEIVSFSWLQSAGDSVSLTSKSPGVVEFVAPQSLDRLAFLLVVTDDRGSTATDEVWVEVRGNEGPVADAGPDIEIGTLDEVELDGSSSFDPEGVIASFRWVQTEGVRVMLDDPSAPTPRFLSPPRASTLRFELEVADELGATDLDEVEVRVFQNAPPVADAGPDLIADVGSLVEFDGSMSFDPDGDVLEFSWRVIEGPAVDLMDAASATVSILVPTEPGVLELELEVTDPRGAKSRDTVRLIPSGAPPALELTFPTEGSDVEGRTNRLIVAGRASDPNGGQIVDLSVNGVGAAFDDEAEPDYWTVEIPIERDEQQVEIIAVAVDQADERSEVRRLIQNQVAFPQPLMWAWDDGAHRAYVVDAARGLLVIDAVSGSRRVLVPPNELPFFSATYLALDEVGQRAFVIGRNSNRVADIDLNTGEVGTLTDNRDFPGPRLEGPFALEVDPVGRRVFVSTLPGNDILAIDMATGARSLVYDGGSQDIYDRIEYDELENRLLVARFNQFLSIDVIAGTMSPLVPPDGTPQRTIQDFAFDESRRWLFVRNFDGIGAIDLTSELWRPISSHAAQLGPTPGNAMVIDGDRILTLSIDRFIQIELEGGARSALLDRRVGSGDAVRFQQAQLAFDSRGQRLFAFQSRGSITEEDVIEISIEGGHRRKLTEVPLRGLMVGLDWDPNTGRVIVSSRDRGITAIDPSTGAGDLLTEDGAQFVAANESDDRLAVAFGIGASTTLEFLDVGTGDRVEVSNMQNQGGVRYSSIRNLVWPEAGPRFLVMDQLNGLIEIDIATSAREVISGGDVGDGPRLTLTSDFDVDLQRRSAYVTAGLGLLAVDLDSGARTSVSSVPRAAAIAVDSANRRAFLAVQDGADAVLVVELTTGEWVVSAR